MTTNALHKLTKPELIYQCEDLRYKLDALGRALDDANDFAAEQEQKAAHAEESWGKHQELRMRQAAELLSDLGVIGPTPQAKYRWIQTGEVAR